MRAQERVLLVDDDTNLLNALQRRLRRKFDVETALCSEEGVTAVNFLGPFAVIVSDMTMPREDGAEFLSRMYEQSPDSVRIMLTGNADQATAVRAVNQAHVFRFLNKPCESSVLEEAISEGIEEHRRIKMEKELMSQTVHGVVAMLSRVLSLTNPVAFGRANRLETLAGEIASAAEIHDPWQLTMAASLSQLGVITLAETTLDKISRGTDLSNEEQQAVRDQYKAAAELIAEAPRLEEVARIVELQSEEISATQDDSEQTVHYAELLEAVMRFEELTTDQDCSEPEALEEIAADERLENAIAPLRKVVAKHDQRRLIEVEPHELSDGMQLVDDLVTTDGMVLIAKGHQVTASIRQRLANYASTHELKSPIRALTNIEAAAAL